jgi:hypothetical protein
MPRSDPTRTGKIQIERRTPEPHPSECLSMMPTLRHVAPPSGRRSFLAGLLLLLFGRASPAAPRRIVERDGWFLDSTDR